MLPEIVLVEVSKSHYDRIYPKWTERGKLYYSELTDFQGNEKK